MARSSFDAMWKSTRIYFFLPTPIDQKALKIHHHIQIIIIIKRFLYNSPYENIYSSKNEINIYSNVMLVEQTKIIIIKFFFSTSRENEKKVQ